MNAPKIVRQNENVRVVVRTSAELFEEGKDDKGKYVGGKWGGLYLRAPDIYFRILEKAGDKLVRLGDVAEVRRGFTTGANEFFYLEPLELTVKEVAELSERDPKAPVRVRNGAGWEGEIEAAWLRPVLKSPREIKTVRVRLEDLRYLVFIPPQDVREAIEEGGPPPLDRYPNAAAYIEWGERAVYVCQKRGCGYRGTDPVCPRHGSDSIERDALLERSTLASRPRWWDLDNSHTGAVAWAMIHADRHNVHDNSEQAELDHNFFEVIAKDKNLQGPLTAVCVSTLAVLSKELLGRQYGGGSGPIKNEGVDLAKFFTLDLTNISDSRLVDLKKALVRYREQSTKALLEEVGYPLCATRRCPHPEHPYEHVHPEKLTLEQVQKASPDRFELDRVVFDVLGLTDEERLEVYRAVARLVKDRLTKARSNSNGG